MRSCFPVKDAAKNTEAITSECWRTRIFTHFSGEACSSLSKKQISAVKKTSNPHIWYNAYNNLTSKKKTRTLIYPELRPPGGIMSDTTNAAPATPQYKHTNRLINETSPYLLQHAHNPVDWYAWGEAALQRAKQEDKPILLSVGYSACHWCHVMERESFENEDIAALMNQHFVSIKVDREERPDRDNIYMQSVLN